MIGTSQRCRTHGLTDPLSPQDEACFLLTELWDMSRQSQHAGWGGRNRVFPTPKLLLTQICHLWLCASSYPRDWCPCSFVRKRHRHQCVLRSAHVSLPVDPIKPPELHQPPTKGTSKQNIVRARGSKGCNKEVIKKYFPLH